MKYKIKSFSLMGNREEQQDAYRITKTKQGVVAVVCDGMGGMNGGSLASNFVADKVSLILSQLNPDSNFSLVAEQLFYRMDDAVFGLTDSNGKRVGCGTTLVSAVIRNDNLYWFSVGDSHFYFVRKEKVNAVVREHNYGYILNEKRTKNEISQEEYQIEIRKKEQLVSYFGMGTAEMYDVNKTSFKLIKGDILFLCTDGVYRALTENELETVLSSKIPIDLKIREIVNRINSKAIHNQDNATGIMIEIV